MLLDSSYACYHKYLIFSGYRVSKGNAKSNKKNYYDRDKLYYVICLWIKTTYSKFVCLFQEFYLVTPKNLEVSQYVLERMNGLSTDFYQNIKKRLKVAIIRLTVAL